MTIDECWQDLQRLGLRSTVSFTKRQDGRVAMEGFPVYSSHQFQLWVLTVLLRLAWTAGMSVQATSEISTPWVEAQIASII